MTMGIVLLATDWWSVTATLVSGAMAAIATMAAVIYTNSRTQKQLKEQKEQFENERKEEFKHSKYVVIKPTIMLTTFFGLRDRLIVQNDYNRVLLFSGDDGFDFYDDLEKQAKLSWRMLLIENKTDTDICEIAISTKTVLRNMDTNARHTYETNNNSSLLRGHESIIIRLSDESQLDKIVTMNKTNIPNTLDFECRIEYLTLANQKITYIYEIIVHNDRNIEVKRDEVESVIDLSQKVIVKPTVFRNLQDSISGIDRSEYVWEKMGQAQMRGLLSQYNLQSTGQNQTSAKQCEADDIKEETPKDINN